MNESSQNLGIEGIYDAGAMSAEPDRPFMPRGTGMDVNQVGIAGIMNQVDNSLFEGPASPQSHQPYYHQGQHNPNTFGGVADTGAQPSGIDQNELRNVMGHADKLSPQANRAGLGDLDEDSLHSVATVIAHINKLVEMMGDDVDLWVPNQYPELSSKLKSVGAKIIPYLNKYVSVIRQLDT